MDLYCTTMYACMSDEHEIIVKSLSRLGHLNVYFNKIALDICAVVVLFIQEMRGERRPVCMYVWGGVVIEFCPIWELGDQAKVYRSYVQQHCLL